MKHTSLISYLYYLVSNAGRQAYYIKKAYVYENACILLSNVV